MPVKLELLGTIGKLEAEKYKNKTENRIGTISFTCAA
jgi:hypothetical protein